MEMCLIRPLPGKTRAPFAVKADMGRRTDAVRRPVALAGFLVHLNDRKRIV
jgi:hypothetical protein